MTLSLYDLLLYAGAVGILFATPGPVWVAITARALSGGFRSAWPLALGVVVGDVIWPFIAILGVSWIVTEISGFMAILRIVASLMFLFMGATLIRQAGKTISSDSRLTKPGMWAGFVAGLIVIMSNPKAVLFYMGVLPGFFDLTRVTAPDIAAICFISFLVPLTGNLLMAVFVDRARALLSSGTALKRTNTIAGIMLILVGLVIPFT